MFMDERVLSAYVTNKRGYILRGLDWFLLGGRGTCDPLLRGLDWFLLGGRDACDSSWRGMDWLLPGGRARMDIAAAKDNLKI